MSTIRSGASLTVAVAVASLAYVLATPDGPHRPVMVGLCAGAVAGGLLLFLLPLERIWRSRLRNVFFASWSVSVTVVLAAGVGLDGGAGSPLVAAFFLPMIYAALSYPLPLTAAIGTLVVASFVGVGVADGDVNSALLWYEAAALGFAAIMCASSARNQAALRRELRTMSQSDPLTGCLNRRGFGQRLSRELRRARHGRTDLAILVLDLDGLKAVNDRLGHAGGDRLLTDAVEAIRDVLRPGDSVGRLGGDEFGVLLPGTAPEQAYAVRDRVEAALEDVAPASVGLACFPVDGTREDAIMRAADRSLYRVKDLRHARAA